MHFEFLTEDNSDIPRRMFIYAGILTAKYDLNVASILFQIKPPPENLPVINRYDVRSFGKRVFQGGYRYVGRIGTDSIHWKKK